MLCGEIQFGHYASPRGVVGVVRQVKRTLKRIGWELVWDAPTTPGVGLGSVLGVPVKRLIWSVEYLCNQRRIMNKRQNGIQGLTPKRELEIAKKVWKFFIKSHPDADMDAIVDLIIEETCEIILRQGDTKLK